LHQGCDDCQEERNKQLEKLKQMKEGVRWQIRIVAKASLMTARPC
jgi:hypothetical protein